MSESRRPSRQVPLARVALLAGEAFGCHPAPDTVLRAGPPSGRTRSALALLFIVCAMLAAYFAI